LDRDPVTAPIQAVGDYPAVAPAPAVASAAGPTARRADLTRRVAVAVRSGAASLCALAIVATVVPLALAQIPDAIAWSLPPRLAAGGPAVVTSVLRASGLALPAMAVAGSLAALAVRWLRAGPVLLAGLFLLAAADALGDAARTVILIGVDRSLHGAGAGVTLAGVIAVITERRAHQRQRPEPGLRNASGERYQPGDRHQPGKRPGLGERHQPGERYQQFPAATGRLAAGWWAAVMVAGLAMAPELMRHRVSSDGWHAALQPYPWLTAAALTLAALYALLAEGTAVATARNAFPAAERAQLALLTAPVAGICAIAVAVTYRGGHAVDAAAIALAGIASITARAGTAGRFAVVCAVTGFVLAPAAGAVTALTASTESTPETGGAVLAAALCGAGLALLPKRPHPRALTATGLVLAAVGLTALGLAGLAAPSGRMLMLLCAPVAVGLAAALTASLRAAGHWTLTAAGLAGAVALALTCIGGHRKGADPEAGPETRPKAAPRSRARGRTRKCHRRRAGPRGRVPCPIMGKLTTVANRIVDRGELCLPGEGASLSEHSVVLIRPDAPGSRGRQVLGQFVPEPA
jgi:hypothetical protein